MFDFLNNFLNNKAVKLGSADLENYLHFLGNDIEKTQCERSAGKLLNTIEHYMKEMATSGSSAAQVSAHFTDFKNSVIRNKSLKDHRDIDFCEGYVLACFFSFLVRLDLPESRARAEMILRHIEQHIGNDLARDPHCLNLLKTLRKLIWPVV